MEEKKENSKWTDEEKTKKENEKLVDEKISEYGQVLLDNKKTKTKNNISYPKSINIILKDMIYIDKANLSSEVKNAFRRLATFANPEFYKKQRLRMSVYNTPMIIDCSKEDEKYIKLPRGI